DLVVTDPYRFRAVPTALEITTALRAVSPAALHLAAKPLDTDWGTDSFREGISGGLSATQIEAGWQPALDHFKALRAKYLLY
ncbi:MAG: DUF1343 domain-containing protein, partial [Candidatus Eremiobacteraeota bacterium]|nr:DUF1343 domain-containing protein [Candidatus Eremiobacteraeota bacterium]